MNLDNFKDDLTLSKVLKPTIIAFAVVGIIATIGFYDGSVELENNRPNYVVNETVEIGEWDSINHAEILFYDRDVRLDCRNIGEWEEQRNRYKCTRAGIK